MKTYILQILLSAVFILLPGLALAESPTMCTMQYEPICGSQQVQCVTAPCYPVYHTYGNSCVMNAEKGYFLHAGECTAKESGPIIPTGEVYVPPAGCTAWFDGCNMCSRSGKNNEVCTLRACMAPKYPDLPATGYCTAYELTTTTPTTPTVPTTPTTPVVQPPHEPTIIAVTATTSEIITDQDQDADRGFFVRLWTIIRGWFSWF